MLCPGLSSMRLTTSTASLFIDKASSKLKADLELTKHGFYRRRRLRARDRRSRPRRLWRAPVAEPVAALSVMFWTLRENLCGVKHYELGLLGRVLLLGRRSLATMCRFCKKNGYVSRAEFLTISVKSLNCRLCGYTNMRFRRFLPGFKMTACSIFEPQCPTSSKNKLKIMGERYCPKTSKEALAKGRLRKLIKRKFFYVKVPSSAEEHQAVEADYHDCTVHSGEHQKTAGKSSFLWLSKK